MAEYNRITEFTDEIVDVSVERADNPFDNEEFDRLAGMLRSTEEPDYGMKFSPSMVDFRSDVIAGLKERLAENGVDGVDLKTGMGTDIDFFRGEDYLGSITIGIYGKEEHAEDYLPNGNKVTDLAGFDWKKIEELEDAAHEILEGEDFAKGLEAISEPDVPQL